MRFKIRVRARLYHWERGREEQWGDEHGIDCRYVFLLGWWCSAVRTVRKVNFLIIISLTSISISTAAPAFAFACVRVTAALLLEELRPNGLTDVLEEACGAQAARAAATASAEEKVGLKSLYAY